MRSRQTLTSTRRELHLLELHLTRWPTSPRLKRRLAEEQARLVRLQAARAREVYRALMATDEATLAQLAQLLGVA